MALQRSAAPLLLASILGLASGCQATPLSSPPSVADAATAATPAPDPADLTALLRIYVDDQGLVNYRALQNNPSQLKTYLRRVAAVSPASYAAWPPQDQIAFLINAYNAITLQSIIEHRPIKASIRDIFGVWKVRTHTVMGRQLSLDAIEHNILRRDFSEPRIHAALVCAAISCPPLRREAYTGPQLNAQLEDQTRRWLAGPHGLVIDRGAGTVKISAIFQWFGQDWTKAPGSGGSVPNHGNQSAVLLFIADHVNADDRAFLLTGDYNLSNLPYDWSLNRR
ncbi:DUF547 domain-containing protein [Synechococcus sp. CCY 9618]|uniref:DUF547 domain-containing protein n=1 Tax=Synechococcus sp. CCY 9618 TaxID=2815602 RepID=UPI001C21B984|nr:DUF547 domain-containing protein [Synechococcus sp. CCY 9618]